MVLCGLSVRRSWPVAVASLFLAGCNTVGPSMLRNGRGLYNDAITATNDQQILRTIVRGRYALNTGLLTVASVTSSVTLAGGSAAEFGIGSDDSFSGNLTPLQISAAYAENPTITYLPVQGEKYLSRLFSPLPLEIALLMIGGSGEAELAMLFLLGGINGVRNPEFVLDGEEPDPRFRRISELFGELLRAGRMSWVQDPETKTANLLMSGYEEEHAEEVRELHSLLGLNEPAAYGPDLVIPVVSSVGPSTDQIRLETRSLYDLLQIGEAVTEVPEEHVHSGLAKAFPPLGVAGRDLRIRRARTAPATASVAIEQGDWWYFIEETDMRTKGFFRAVEVILTVLMSDATSQFTPLLTLPVTR